MLMVGNRDFILIVLAVAVVVAVALVAQAIYG
jgi:hypothetical protein